VIFDARANVLASKLDKMAAACFTLVNGLHEQCSEERGCTARIDADHLHRCGLEQFLAVVGVKPEDGGSGRLVAGRRFRVNRTQGRANDLARRIDLSAIDEVLHEFAELVRQKPVEVPLLAQPRRLPTGAFRGKARRQSEGRVDDALVHPRVLDDRNRQEDSQDLLRHLRRDACQVASLMPLGHLDSAVLQHLKLGRP
jgi:hypothetical protein